MKKICFIILFFITYKFIYCQVGTDFWFAPPNVTEYHNPPNFPIYLLITSLDEPATVTISKPADPTFTPLVYNLPPATSQRVDLTSFRTGLETQPTNTILNTGLRIQSTAKITAYYEVSNTNNNELYSLKGENALGTEFYIPMHKDTNFYNHHFSNTPLDLAIASFDIVASENNTTVYIYSPVPLDGIPANTMVSYTLNQGQTLSCGTTQTGSDPDGSGPMTNYYQHPKNHPAGAIVISDKPIAITYKDDSDHDRPAGGCYDLIGDQIIPIDIAGTEYIAVKGGLANNGRESVILTGIYNNTQIFLNGNTTPIKTMVAGETYQIIIDSLNSSTNNAIYIKSSKPVIATHITGFGCELGSAILPPLTCAGSKKVSFVRSSTETFILTFLVKTSAINDFIVTPNTFTISPSDFKVVPGTNGLWSAAKITLNTTQVPINTAYTISNTSSLFALGIINGGATTGCRYGYFSEFVAKIQVDAGPNQTICSNQTVQLNGSVSGGATQGVWTTSGSGTFIPNANTLNAIYVPSATDILNGSVTLTLTSVSDCYPVSSNTTITILPAPQANAGNDVSVCANNANVNLNGSVSYATGGIWIGGNGTFIPNNTTLNATYIPTSQEISSGSLTLKLVTTGNGICDPDTDEVVIYFTPAPTANAGTDVSVCANNPNVLLNGIVTVATGGVWIGGTGSFNPGPNALATIYTPSAAEIAAGTLTLTLTTTGNGNCNAVSDDIIITFTPAPTVNAGIDQTKCKNNATITLNGTVNGATGGIWTGGTGVFSPNNTTLNATYTPSASELANGFVNLTLTSTGNGNCNAVSDDILITFTNAPTVDAGPDVTVCANNANVQLNGTVNGATGGIWTTSGTGTFSPDNTTLNAIYIPSSQDKNAGTVTLTLTSTGNGLCNPVSDQMTITITPAPVVNAGSDISVCKNNATVTLYGSVQNAGGGIWSGGLGSFSPSNTALNTYYYPSPAEIQNGHLTLTLTSTGNGNCLAVSDQVDITFTEPPTVNAGEDQIKCSNNPAITLNGSVIGASGGTWSGGLGIYSPNANTLNAVYYPTAQEIANGVTLTLTSTGNGNCNAVSDQMSVTFTPAPIVDAGPDGSVCANNSNITLNGNVQIASGGVWSGGLGTFIPNNTTLNATYIPSASEIIAGQVILTLTSTGNGNCNAVSDQVKYTITPSPAVNAGSNQSACVNNPTVQLNGNVQNAGGGIWSGGSGVFNPSNTALNATYTPTPQEIANGSVTLILTSTQNGNCFAVKDSMIINFTSAPIVDAGPDQIKCVNNPNITLNGTVIGASGGQWTGGLGQFIPNNNSLNCIYIPTAGEIASGSITLTLTSTGNGSCLPVSDNVTITFTPAPTVNAGVDQVKCANNPVVSLNGTYSIASGVRWSGGNGIFSPSDTSINATYTPTAAEIAAGSVTLTLTTTGNGNCLAVSDNVTIFYTPAPIVNAGPDINSCANNPTKTLNGYVLNAGGGIWSGGNGTFNPSPTVLNASYTPTQAEIDNGYVDLTLTSTGNGSCLAVSDVVRIYYAPAPIVNAGPDQTVCANNNLVTLNGTIQNAGGGSWSNGSGTYYPNNNILTATYTPSQSEINNGYAMLILTSTGNGECLAVKDTMYIYYTPAPTADAGNDITICKNNPIVNLNGNVTVAGGGIWTGGQGTFNPSNTALTTTYIPSSNELNSPSFTLTLTTTNNGNCNAVSDNITINVISPPLVNAGPDKVICSDNLIVPLQGYISGPTNTGIWSTSGTGVFVPSATSLITNYIPSSADSLAGYVTLYLTSTNNGLCNPVVDSMQVMILPGGIAMAGSDITVCANNAIVHLNGTVGGGATSGYWSTSGTGVFLPNNLTLNATYIPSSLDTALGTVYLILTANSCNIAKDTLVLTITDAPYVNAGPDQTTCVDNLDIQLNGVIYGASTTGFWTTTGTGYFTPSNTALNAIYHASPQDSINLGVTLILTATNIGNCSPVSDTMVINILPPGIVNAGQDQVLCANNNNVQLNGYVGGGASQGMWQTSGSGTFIPNNTTLNATYIPSEADLSIGQVTLVLLATNSCNFAFDVLQVNFTPAPTANAGSDQSICKNNNIANLNGSYSIASGIIWTSTGSGTFVPDNTSTNVQYIPSQADLNNGSVEIILTTTGNGNCLPAYDTITITYTPSPNVNAGMDQYVCITGEQTNLYGVITGGASEGIWTTLGDGYFEDNTNLHTVYHFGNADTSNGSVNLILTSINNGNCLAVSDTITLFFTNTPFVYAGTDKEICVNNPNIALQGIVTGGSTTGIWSTTGNGTFSPSPTNLNATYTISSTDSLNGFVQLILTSTNNGTCQAGRDTINVYIYKLPQANAGNDIYVCLGAEQIPLNGSINNSTGCKWTTLGSGTFIPNDTTINAIYVPSPFDEANGIVTIILETTGNTICPQDKDTTKILFFVPLTPAFSYTTPCLNSPVQFTDNSIVSIGSITNWHWTFDNQQTDYNPNPIYTFNTIGNHTVELTVTSSLGCSYTLSKNIYVNPLPSADFTNTINCYLDTIKFTDHSTIQNGNINNWFWNFGDSSVNSSIQNPSHLYNSPGTYNVELTVTSDSGCTSSIIKQIQVYPKPEANFSYVDNCSNFNVSFTDLSTSVNELTINSWNWNFGDGNSSNNQNPEHTYQQAGNYPVTLIVGVSNNCTDTITQNIITTNVIANFGFSQTCNSNFVTLSDSSIANASNIISWNWSFGDGNTSTSQNPSYYYQNVGNYTIQLIVSSEYCSDTITKEITLQYLSGDFTFIYDCQNFTTTFNNTSTYYGISPNEWYWSFGDGNISNLENPVHTYTDTGTYNIQFIINTPGVCSDTVTKTISIFNVKADFQANNSCISDTIKFIDKTHYPYGNIISWLWNFGDESISNIQNPLHIYKLAKTYNVSLIITTEQGCIDTVIKQITIYPSPIAQFNIISNEFKVNTPINFVDASVGANSWMWDFGDNFGTSTNQNPSYTYLYPGNYKVTEIVRNEYGCKDSAIQTINVQKAVEIYAPVLPTAFTPNNDGNNDTLYVRGGPFKEILFRVYNEWGQIIFESTDASIGWDGKYNGVPQPIGVYVCTVKAITINNKEYSFSQEVTLIR